VRGFSLEGFEREGLVFGSPQGHWDGRGHVAEGGLLNCRHSQSEVCRQAMPWRDGRHRNSFWGSCIASESLAPAVVCCAD
jgi:hypothetical protein